MFATLSTHVTPASASKAALRAALPALLAAGLTLAPATGAEAQDAAAPTAGTVSFDVRGGVALPAGEQSLGAVTKTGASFGGGVSIHLTPSVALAGGVDYQLLSGELDSGGTLFPDMTLLHATGGLEFHFLEPETPWTGSLFVGAGISNMQTADELDGPTTQPVPVAVDLTGLSFRGAVKMGYRPAPGVTLYLEPGAYLMTLDRQHTVDFAAASADVPGAFDVGWVIPVQAGVSFQL